MFIELDLTGANPLTLRQLWLDPVPELISLRNLVWIFQAQIDDRSKSTRFEVLGEGESVFATPSRGNPNGGSPVD